jgi:hypothetical protein
MWMTFWDGVGRLSPSNRRAVVPGGWRMEVSPATPGKEDVFLNVLEIGDRGVAGTRQVSALEGHGLTGAAVEGDAVVLFADGPLTDGEATLPDVKTTALLLTGLEPGASYEVQVTSGFAPGAPVWRSTAEAGDESTMRLTWDGVRDGRLRLRRLR